MPAPSQERKGLRVLSGLKVFGGGNRIRCAPTPLGRHGGWVREGEVTQILLYLKSCTVGPEYCGNIHVCTYVTCALAVKTRAVCVYLLC